MTDDEIERAMLGVWQDVPGAVNFGIAKPLTDRELLELAAKAAGLHDLTYFDEGAAGGKGMRRDELDRDNWNPLENDGDALRLAVMLFLHVSVDDGFTEAQGDYRPLTEAHDGDPYSATRRAIVRAAAEIGRAME